MHQLKGLTKYCQDASLKEEPEHKIDSDGKEYLESLDLVFEEHPEQELLYVSLFNHNGEQLIGKYSAFDAYKLLIGRQNVFL